MTTALIGQPGWVEILIVIIFIVLLFGARRLPELARALGKSIGEFKKGREEGQESEDEGKKDGEDANASPEA